MQQAVRLDAGDARWNGWVEETSRRFHGCSIYDRKFVRAKLRRDPLYRAVLERLQDEPCDAVLDLGCGRGIVLALLDTQWRSVKRDDRNPPALMGVERVPRLAHVAQAALAHRAHIEIADLEGYAPPRANAVLLLDVLHYLDERAQAGLIARTAAMLPPGGRVLIREPDRTRGLRFWFTRASERACALARVALRQRFHYRTAKEWMDLIEAHGLKAAASSLSRGTPFANVLIEGKKPPR